MESRNAPRSRGVAHRLEHRGGVALGARPARHDATQGVAVPLLRDEGQWRSDLEHEERAQLLGCLGDVLPVEGHHVGCRVELEEDRPTDDVADGVQTELE